MQVVALCFLALLIDGFDVQIIGYVAPALRQSLRVDPSSMSIIFSAGLLGIMAGALVLGTLADSFGRRPMILACLVFVGITTLATALTTTVTTFIVLRFVTGLGLGGITPNGYALTSEYSPVRSRATATMVMSTGFSLGAVLGGILAARLIPVLGWRSVFYFGAIFPIVVAAVLAFALPESIRYLVLKREHGSRVAVMLSRISAGNIFPPGTQFVVREENQNAFPVQYLFREGRAGATMLLWLVSIFCLIDLYFLTNWLPTLALNTGLGMRRAVVAGLTLQVGGTIGAVALGRLIDKNGYYNVLSAAFVLGGVAIAAIGAVGPLAWAVMISAFVAGFCVIGSQIGLSALAASYYPTFIRSSGVGWSLGIGRLGSLAGTIATGYLLSLRWKNPSLFLLAAFPALAAGIGLRFMKIAASANRRMPAGGVPTDTPREIATLPPS